MHTTMGIMAGSGQFPFLVAQGAKEAGMRVVICGFHDNTAPELAQHADAFTLLPLGQLGGIIQFFKQHGARKICMAGAISKPKALDIKPDMRAAKLIFRLMGNRGDDAILRAVADELAGEGIEVVRPDELVPGLSAEPGVLSSRRPDEELWQDIAFGWRKAKQIGAMDIGQCIVVRGGVVMAVEAIEGTDAALARGGSLGGTGCTAVKVVKPGQDTRLDLPSIGLNTIQLLADHNFACIAFEASGTLFFDREKALKLAAQHNIAVVAVPADADAFFAQHI